MKLQNKWFIGAMLGAAVCLVSTSCVDEIKFGNSFLDKAPGGNATIDTVFNSAEYTRQFLNTCYSRQYYGLPYNTDSNGNIPDSSSPYLGKKDALTDCWSLYFSDATVYQQYYLGSLNANYGTRSIFIRKMPGSGYPNRTVIIFGRLCYTKSSFCLASFALFPGR